MNLFRPAVGATLLGLVLASSVHAQKLELSKEQYLTAPKEIADVLATAGRNDIVALTNISPDGKRFLDHQERRHAVRAATRLSCT